MQFVMYRWSKYGYYILVSALVLIALRGAGYAVPQGASCAAALCDPGLICKNARGATIPANSGTGSCQISCNNNGYCDSSETSQYCATDCHCGNGICEISAPYSENTVNCSNDCRKGDGVCDSSENDCSSPNDCGAVCGDGCCRIPETAASCGVDCGTCGNGVQDPGENPTNCPADVSANVCGDGDCSAGESLATCSADCTVCGDSICTSPQENLSTCAIDCRVCGDGTCSRPWETNVLGSSGSCSDCQVAGCFITAADVCAGDQATYSCTARYATSALSMVHANPYATSTTGLLQVNFATGAIGAATIQCYTQGSALCTQQMTIGYCGDEIVNCSEQCDFGGGCPDACDAASCTRKSCSTDADCGCAGVAYCLNGSCSSPIFGDGIISAPSEQCEITTDCSGFGTGYICASGTCVLSGTSIASCDPSTIYPAGAVPGRSCPEGRSLKGCPGNYMCVFRDIEAIICTTCGDGTKDASEPCDRSDTNDPNHDRCTSSCELSYCGDGTVNTEQGEQCDYGSFCEDGTTPCTSNPSACPGGPAACQPRYVNGCTSTCKLGCGDGVVDADGVDNVAGNADDEACDDMNLNDRDACTNSCKRPVCGDDIVTTFATRSDTGVVTVIETCDDGNLDDGDDCPSNCRLSGTVINGICNFSLQSMLYYNDTGLALSGPPQGERCSAGEPTSLAYDATDNERTWTCLGLEGGASMDCSLGHRFCGDGVVDERGSPQKEHCDDGNFVDGDGCTHNCLFEAPISFTYDNQCTTGSLPAIQEDELLPMRWQGTTGGHFLASNASICDSAEANGILPVSLKCNFDVYRGDPTGSGSQKAGSLAGIDCINPLTPGATGYDLLLDAMGDFGFPVDSPEINQIVGTHFVSSGNIYGLVHTGGQDVYGQYQFRLADMHFTYCAYTRSDIGSTVSSGGAPGQFEICNNNMDDDGDSLIDCLDDACSSANNCTAPSGNGTETDCYDNVDNDGDTKTDCADSDCSSAANCQPSVTPENCANGQDDNANGQIDCSDPLCASTPFCLATQGTTEGGTTLCKDGIDNDMDFLIDCNDPGCKSMRFCKEGLNNGLCSDGLDNEPKRSPTGSTGSSMPDNDGLIDCNDPQCIRPEVGSYCSPSQLEAYCYNGSDEDADTLLDCDDYYCQFVGMCLATGTAIPTPGRSTQPPIENCSDGLDNDLDGRVDCADFNCKTATHCTTPQGANGTLEDCTNYIDNNDDDSYADCADYDCHLQRNTLCIAEQCFNGADDDGDGLVDCADSQCLIFCGGAGSGGVSVPVMEAHSLQTFPGTGMVATGSAPLCQMGFGVSKQYFVQQGVTLSEEANVGLDENFVSIEGISIVSEGTAFDDSLNQVATYQGEGKTYLFDEFIDTYDDKALFDVTAPAGLFKKVPNAAIFYYQGATDLILNTASVRQILINAGFPALRVNSDDIPFTVVIPTSGVDLIVQGSLLGKGMYVTIGDISFAAAGCDDTDVIEGIFLTKGTFHTDRVRNDSVGSDERCKGGNLNIKGVLLGLGAGEALASQRRSVLNPRNPTAYLFDDSVSYQAKRLFEVCYAPQLVKAKMRGLSSEIATATGPVAGCNITSRPTKIAASVDTWKQSLPSIFSYVIGPGLACNGTTDCNPKKFAMLQLMPSTSSSELIGGLQQISGAILEQQGTQQPANSAGTNIVGSVVLPKTLVFTLPTTAGGTQNVTINLSDHFKQQMIQQGKLLPAWRLETCTSNTCIVNMTDPQTLAKMANRLSRSVEDVRQYLLGFRSPYRNKPSGVNYTLDLAADSLINKIVFVRGLDHYFNYSNICSASYLTGADGKKYTIPAHCNLTYYPDFVWLKQSAGSGAVQEVQRGNEIVAGSSLSISAEPRSWETLPPGAKNFLDSLYVTRE